MSAGTHKVPERHWKWIPPKCGDRVWCRGSGGTGVRPAEEQCRPSTRPAPHRSLNQHMQEGNDSFLELPGERRGERWREVGGRRPCRGGEGLRQCGRAGATSPSGPQAQAHRERSGLAGSGWWAEVEGDCTGGRRVAAGWHGSIAGRAAAATRHGPLPSPRPAHPSPTHLTPPSCSPTLPNPAPPPPPPQESMHAEGIPKRFKLQSMPLPPGAGTDSRMHVLSYEVAAAAAAGAPGAAAASAPPKELPKARAYGCSGRCGSVRGRDGVGGGWRGWEGVGGGGRGWGGGVRGREGALREMGGLAWVLGDRHGLPAELGTGVDAAAATQGAQATPGWARQQQGRTAGRVAMHPTHPVGLPLPLGLDARNQLLPTSLNTHTHRGFVLLLLFYTSARTYTCCVHGGLGMRVRTRVWRSEHAAERSRALAPPRIGEYGVAAGYRGPESAGLRWLHTRTVVAQTDAGCAAAAVCNAPAHQDAADRTETHTHTHTHTPPPMHRCGGLCAAAAGHGAHGQGRPGVRVGVGGG